MLASPRELKKVIFPREMGLLVSRDSDVIAQGWA